MFYFKNKLTVGQIFENESSSIKLDKFVAEKDHILIEADNLSFSVPRAGYKGMRAKVAVFT